MDRTPVKSCVDVQEFCLIMNVLPNSSKFKWEEAAYIKNHK